jgi:ribosomal protein L32E
MPRANEIVGGVRLGFSPAGLIPVQVHNSPDLAEVSPHRNFGRCVGGITTRVTISASLLWLLSSEERRK